MSRSEYCWDCLGVGFDEDSQECDTCEGTGLVCIACGLSERRCECDEQP